VLNVSSAGCSNDGQSFAELSCSSVVTCYRSRFHTYIYCVSDDVTYSINYGRIFKPHFFLRPLNRRGSSVVVVVVVVVEQKSKKLSLSSSHSGGSTLEELAHGGASEGRLIPSFVRTCIEYIEQEGIMSEGLYRVPGNRAHVDQLLETLRQG